MRWAGLWHTLGWLLVAATAMLSLLPAQTLPAVGVSDKVEHALTYALLTVWFRGAYRQWSATVVGLGLFALGAAMEGLQGLTTTRSTDIADLAANVGGILCGLALAKAGLDHWCAMVESWLSADR